MTEDKNKNEVKKESETSQKISEHNHDPLFGKNKEQTLDSETMILETQKRVWGGTQKRL